MRGKFSSELKEAMKAGEKRRVGTIRMIMAALKDKDIEARGQGKTVSDEDILALLQKMTKSRKESQEIYEKGGPRRPRRAKKRGSRDHPGLFAATAKRGGSGAGDRRRRRRDQGLLDQGDGKSGRRAQRKIFGPDGFCEGQRTREENAWRISLRLAL
jgi:Yqey-like protein